MDPKKQIFDAITKNDVNSVRDLISQIDTLNFYKIESDDDEEIVREVSYLNETPLMYASRLGHKEIVSILINAGANINILGRFGYTALMKAVENGYNKEIVSILIDAGADINILNFFGVTALMFAAKTGYKEIVSILIDSGANPNILDEHGTPALMEAVTHKDKEIIVILLNAGADPNIQSTIGYSSTSLISAAYYGYEEIVFILLEAGADINLKDPDGLTALDIAFKRKHLNIVHFIKNYIPDDPDHIDDNGFTNLMIVASNGPTYKLREFLKRVKNVDAQDPSGNTALIYAVKFGNFQRVELLLNVGANPLIENLENKSAYHYMMKSSDPKTRKLGNDVFIASTQSDIVTSEFGTYQTRRAAERFRREYREEREGEEIRFPENLRPEYREFYAECAKDDNWEKVFKLAEILGVPRKNIESKSQAEICLIIRRFISLLT